MARNRALAAEGAQMVAAALAVPIAGTPGMRAAMAAFALDEHGADAERAAQFRRALAHEHGIMAPAYIFADRLWLRISAQIYNKPADYERLVAACQSLLAGRAPALA
jgi:isopenicillin-N epimerase